LEASGSIHAETQAATSLLLAHHQLRRSAAIQRECNETRFVPACGDSFPTLTLFQGVRYIRKRFLPTSRTAAADYIITDLSLSERSRFSGRLIRHHPAQAAYWSTGLTGFQ
jgi:hypothetical protein